MKMIANYTAVTGFEEAGIMSNQLYISQENFEDSEKHKNKLKISNNQTRENILFFICYKYIETCKITYILIGIIIYV